ncbi:APC family permease [Streptomyces sp. NPDC017936]|uniref:APC family permease n=1 Tax=Streptomyces sp. NPDC017936 TaxID=3365016 RepID=UPI00379EFE6E
MTFKRLIVGRPLSNDRLGEQMLPKRIALPVFASDPLSSVAYATQEILLVLTLGGLAYLYLAPWVAAAVVLLLAVVVLSYRQVVQAYPSGGGSYEVASRNLGPWAGLVVASALMVDYVMTVAVSVAAGVDNIISAVPALGPYRVAVNLGFVALLTAMNLRGVRESGRMFAVPTYLFIAGVLAMVVTGLLAMVVTGLLQTALGHAPVAESAGWQVRAEPGSAGLTGAALVLLALRAFSSGCTALTGAEAISNGVPAFRPPKARNAAATMAVMGGLSIGPSRTHAVVPVSQLHQPALRALGHARITRPDTLTALTVEISEEEVGALRAEREQRQIPVPLTVMASPYRDITGSVLEYIARLHREHPQDLIAVYIPEYVVGHRWEQLLHDQSALRLKARLLFQRGVMVTSVPWQLGSSSRAAPPQPTPAPPGTTFGVGWRFDDEGLERAAHGWSATPQGRGAPPGGAPPPPAAASRPPCWPASPKHPWRRAR